MHAMQQWTTVVMLTFLDGVVDKDSEGVAD